MKKIILSIIVLSVIGLTSCKKETKTETKTTTKEMTTKKVVMKDLSFGVRGNCGMCKNTIEKAASDVDGVSKAIWNKDKKKIEVSYNTNKTNEMDIHNAIAASGYDTEKVDGSLEVYNSLPECCKYDHKMEMNQK